MSWFAASTGADRCLGSSGMASQMAAVNRSQAVIDFSPDGKIIHANL